MDPNAPSPRFSRKTIRQRFSIYLKKHYAFDLPFLTSTFFSSIPILSWLPKYQLNYLPNDIISGISILILHIPQGLAYGMLASMQPANGLYVSFFPVLIYFIFGSSKHISVGTMAVVSLMVGGTVAKIEHMKQEDILTFTSSSPSHLEIATTLAIEVGFIQLFMGVFSIGLLTVVFSDPLVTGFILGSAIHVATAQWSHIFDIHLKTYTGNLQLIYKYQDLFRNLKHTNLVTLLISIIAIAILCTVKLTFDERFQQKMKMPFPIDLIVVIIATLCSHFGKFNQNYGVSIIRISSTGLPNPKTPRFDLLSLLIGDSLAISIVSYAISLSLAKLFAKVHKYEINANQELLALGFSNVFASFFSCFPCSASLSRSLMQDKSGGKTQVASLVSCCFLLAILYVLAPLFYSLPDCILSSIILVALRSFGVKALELPRICKVSIIDGSIWVVAFLATVLLDVTTGLFVGIAYSILAVLFRISIPTRTFLGKIQDTSTYVDVQSYDEAEEIPGFKIFHFEAALCFINKDIFKASLFRYIPFHYQLLEEGHIIRDERSITCIIIDCSSFSFVDISGLETLLEVMKMYNEVGVTVYLANCSVGMLNKLIKSKFTEKAIFHPYIFHTIQDAIEFHQRSSSTRVES